LVRVLEGRKMSEMGMMYRYGVWKIILVDALQVILAKVSKTDFVIYGITRYRLFATTVLPTVGTGASMFSICYTKSLVESLPVLLGLIRKITF